MAHLTWCMAAVLLLGSLIPQTEADVCELPAEAGICEAHIPAWYYNVESEQCEEFIYGGCGGNDNRFDKKSDCEEECMKADVCELPSDTGPCRARFFAWYYDVESEQCEEFIYGGCGGNGNRFHQKSDCEAACMKDANGTRSAISTKSPDASAATSKVSATVGLLWNVLLIVLLSG